MVWKCLLVICFIFTHCLFELRHKLQSLIIKNNALKTVKNYPKILKSWNPEMLKTKWIQLRKYSCGIFVKILVFLLKQNITFWGYFVKIQHFCMRASKYFAGNFVKILHTHKVDINPKKLVLEKFLQNPFLGCQ